MKELTGLHSVYTFMPRSAFEIGQYTVERDGSLTVEEAETDTAVLNTLLDEGLIIGDLPEETNVETTETSEIAESETAEAENADCLSISFPVSQHTGNSLRNLIRLLYSRGDMINKAVGSHFRIDKGLIKALSDDRCTYSPVSLRTAVEDYENENGTSMSGIKITDEEVTLTGFPLTEDSNLTKACTELAVLMNKMSIKQKRIQAKEIDSENEKYAFRIWLLRLGMNGTEYKQTRKLLMENLEGNCAFRTEEETEKFKVKEKQKRDALKATKAAEQDSADEDNVSEQDSADEDNVSEQDSANQDNSE